jgi:hypothetical protein
MYLDCTTDYQAKVSGIAGRASFIASAMKDAAHPGLTLEARVVGRRG